MAEGFFDKIYNPDVLSCLANLSNDEVSLRPKLPIRCWICSRKSCFRTPTPPFWTLPARVVCFCARLPRG